MRSLYFLQHYLIMFGATLWNPLTLTPHLCIEADNYEAQSHLIGTIFVASGSATLMQAILGIRSDCPIQGPISLPGLTYFSIL